MKTCKGLLLKAKDDKRDPLLAILDWRNTPSVKFSTSPVQRLMGRRTRTLLPTAEKLLQPNCDLKTTGRSLAARKRLQCKQYNRGTKNLIPLKVGEAIRIKLPGEHKWSLGRCSRLLGRRSYEVQVDGRCFRRNHRQLRSTLKPSPVPSSNNEELPQTENESRSPHQPENESRSPVAPEPVPAQYQTPSRPVIQDSKTKTALNQSQRSYLDIPGEPDVPLPGSRIMTYVEHLNIELNLPLFFVVDVVNIVREKDVA